MEFEHRSVLLDECIEGLHIRPDGIYVDGTLGGAGHSFEIAKRLNKNGRLIGIDQDEDAIRAASERLECFDNVTIVRSNYENIKSILADLGIEKVDGIIRYFLNDFLFLDIGGIDYLGAAGHTVFLNNILKLRNNNLLHSRL